MALCMTLIVLAVMEVSQATLPQNAVVDEGQTISDINSSVLHLSFSNESGQPVKITKALLTAIEWGDVQKVSLPAGTSEIIIPFNLAWLKEQTTTKGYRQHFYFEAEGYAPIQSNVFPWPGSYDWINGDSNLKILEVGQHARVILEEDKDIHLNVIFRKLGKRRLRFVDEAGMPMSGVKFTYGPYCFNECHCGWVATIEDYGQCISDDKGRADIRDGDIEYLFAIEKDRFSAVTPEPASDCNPYIDGIIARLSAKETIIVLHRWLNLPLELQVLQDGKPVKQRMLTIMLAECCCGACGGPLATSDANGKITVPDFYPEKYEYIVFYDANNKHEIWKMTLEEILSKGLPKIVQLPPDNEMLPGD